jgi:hypothetical protein
VLIMKTKLLRPLVRETCPVQLLDVVVTVSDLAASEAEAARVINHLLLAGYIRFTDELDHEEISLLDS